MDNMARNVIEMAAQGATCAQIRAETGWTPARIRRTLAQPEQAVARYEEEEIPRMWALARRIHNARPGDCGHCRYRRDGLEVCVAPVCYLARWEAADALRRDNHGL